MKRKITSILLVVMVALAFSMADVQTVSAASKPKKVKSISVSSLSQSSIRISWSKVKGAKGYQLCRNGAAVKSGNVRSFTDSGLRAGTKYTYKVRAYKTSKKKMWYNKKTSKWQKKKPKKKWRGKSKKVTVYHYGAFSYTAAAATRPAPTPTPTPTPGGDSGGGTPGDSGTTTPSSKTVTDYLGVTRTITPENMNWGKPIFDRTIDGEFTASGCGQMKQLSGATFIMGQIEDATNGVDGNLYIPAYNLDTSKLSIQYGNGVTVGMQRNTYTNPAGTTLNSYKPYYFVKDGKRIAETTTNGNPVRFEAGAYDTMIKRKDLVTTIKVAIYKDGDGMGHALGFYNADIPVIVKYDGKDVGTITVSSCKTATVNGKLSNMHPKRALALDVAVEGIRAATGSENGTGNLKQDLNLLASWFGENYDHASYPGTKTTITKYGVTEKVGCELCTYILETWAIYKYGEQGLGFAGWGLGSDGHYAFHLDSDKNVFYDTTYRNQ